MINLEHVNDAIATHSLHNGMHVIYMLQILNAILHLFIFNDLNIKINIYIIQYNIL